MSVPSTYVQIAISPLTSPLQVEAGTDRTPLALTKGQMYRVKNYGNKSLQFFSVSSGSGAGDPFVNLAGGSSTTFTSPHAIAYLRYDTNVAGSFDLEPLLTETKSGAQVSPLAFVMACASETDHSLLVGTFFNSNGQPLIRPGDTTALQRIIIYAASNTLGRHLFATSEPMWADAAEFRGVLYGAPLRVTEGSNSCNPPVPEDVEPYEPERGSLLIYPGTVRLGPNGVDQSSRVTGYCVEPHTLASDSISNGYPVAYDYDLCGSTLTRLFVKAALDEGDSNASYTVTAYPVTLPVDLAITDPLVSSNPTLQETFAFETGPIVNHVELDPGNYHIEFNTTHEEQIALEWYFQRIL